MTTAAANAQTVEDFLEHLLGSQSQTGASVFASGATARRPLEAFQAPVAEIFAMLDRTDCGSEQKGPMRHSSVPELGAGPATAQLQLPQLPSASSPFSTASLGSQQRVNGSASAGAHTRATC
jgi:hypothetical protein